MQSFINAYKNQWNNHFIQMRLTREHEDDFLIINLL